MRLTASQKEKYESRFKSISAGGTPAEPKPTKTEKPDITANAFNSSQDKEIEEILKSITIGDMSSPAPTSEKAAGVYASI